MSRAYIKDLRHRYSYELRPDAQLDAAVRDIARALEAAGLLEDGAASAPRFQPHLTFCRAARFEQSAVPVAAEIVARDPGLRLADTVTFGDGRIICLVPDDRALLDEARAALLEQFAADELDPAVHVRAWTPHVTVAYAVPEPARTAARELVASRLPLDGRWERAQSWDLDVRPTALVADVPCVPATQDG